MYRYILESEYQLHVSRMLLGVVHPQRGASLCLEVPRMDAEISLILKYEGSPAPVPGPDAPFSA